jgi:hypothetical protein
MTKNMTKAQLLAALEAAQTALAAQAAPVDGIDAQEVIILDDAPLGAVQAASRAANYEPRDNGSKAAIYQGKQGFGSTFHAPTVRAGLPDLIRLWETYGDEEFVRVTARRMILDTWKTDGGRPRAGSENRANGIMTGLVNCFTRWNKDAGIFEPSFEGSPLSIRTKGMSHIWKIDGEKLAKLKADLNIS